MVQNNLSRFWYIGRAQTIIPSNSQIINLDIFVNSKTFEVYVGNKRPSMELDIFSSKIGKAKKPIYYDLSQKL